MLRNAFFALVVLFGAATAAVAEPPAVNLANTVVKMPLEEGVTADDAVDSMKLRANRLNIQLVAELPLSKQIRAMGEESRRIGIYQFCDPLTAKRMVEYDLDFAAYLPCRISLVEDADGQVWLVMMNLDMLLKGQSLDPDLRKAATQVRDTLEEIMRAGATGAL